MKCSRCSGDIHPLRLKVLPHTTTCVNCSTVGRVGGFPLIQGKTEYSQLEILPEEVAEHMLWLQDRAGMSPGHGMKGHKKKHK